ncbi:MAG: DUF3810 domain-containing protein [Acetatifactor sp.]
MKKRKNRIAYMIAVFIVLLNVTAWNSTRFSDWYIAHIFPIWVNTWGRITGLFPFSVGEWLIMAGLAVLAVAVLLGLMCAVTGIVRVIRNKTFPEFLKRFAKGYYRFLAWTLLIVCLIMTLNCFILYHASTFSEHYFGESDEEYTLEELIIVYNVVAENCNRLAEQMERDETGMVIYTGSTGDLGNASYEEQLRDMADQARKLMQQLGQEYEQLDGWYPRPKAMLFSDFMCQQHMQGYYFPFSMEANYNDVMHILNIPSTMCHELAHLRGYIYEDEANFIGYLACVQSEDAFIEYAGYLSVLNYLYNDLYKAWQTERSAYEAAVEKVQPVAVSEQVWEDNIFVSDEEWERINGKALIDTEVVDKATDVLVDANLKVNGVSDGKISYSRVVRLLLQYYCSK